MKDSLELTPTMTLNEITSQYPATIAVFNDFGIDVCCGGDVSLAEATVRDGADLVALKTALADAVSGNVARRS